MAKRVPQKEAAVVILCYAQHHASRWEAFCLDFDLAVQGRSFSEVKERLEGAIVDYVEAALAESEPARSQLLSRRAPFSVRFLWGWRFFWAAIFSRNRDGDSPVGFPVSCPA